MYIVRCRDRTKTAHRISASDVDEIDIGFFDPNTDRFVLNRPAPMNCHDPLMLFIVVIRAVIKKNHEKRDFIVCRRPQRARVKQKIAIRLDADADFARSLQGQRRAERSWKTVAHASEPAPAQELIKARAVEEAQFLQTSAMVGQDKILVV